MDQQSLKELLMLQKAKQRYNSMPQLEGLPQDSNAQAGCSSKKANQQSLREMRSSIRKSIMTKDEQVVFWMRK